INPYDSDAASVAGLPRIDLTTANTLWKRLGTPIDTVKFIDEGNEWDNLKPQLEFYFCIIETLLNMQDLRPAMGRPWKPMRVRPGGVGRWHGFMRHTGQIVEWDPFKQWYKPVPNALVVVHVPLGGPNYQGQWRVVRPQVYMTDDNGTYYIIAPIAGGGCSDVTYEMDAFVVDETGHIIYGPDRGQYGQMPYTGSSSTEIGGLHNDGLYTVFKCGSLVLYDAVWPSSLIPPDRLAISINDFATHTPVEHFGYLGTYQISGYSGHSWGGAKLIPLGAWVIFTPPNRTLEIYFGSYPRIFTVLLNNSEGNPYGVGYRIKVGEQIHLSNSILHYVKNLYWLDHERIRSFLAIGLRITGYELHQETGRLLREAEIALSSYDYDRACALLTEAWSKEYQVYDLIFKSGESATSTIPFFALVLVPFALLAERLFFDAEGKKRIIGVVIPYILLVALLWRFHPGFIIASNAMMVLVGFVILILMGPIFLILVERSLGYLRELRLKFIGPHFMKKMRFSELLMIIAVAIRHMRKRPLRSSLALISIILVTMCLVSFSSLSVVTRTLDLTLRTDEALPYDGILAINAPIGIPATPEAEMLLEVGAQESIHPIVLENIITKYGDVAHIAPRTWGGMATVGSERFITVTTPEGRVWKNDGSIFGLSPAESEALRYDQALIPGKGRWFIDTDEYAIIISDEVAEILDIDRVPAQVRVQGIPFTVIGIVNHTIFDSIYEITGERITPPDPLVPTNPPPLLVERLIIMPWRTALKYGADIVSVVIKPKDPELIKPIAKELFEEYGITAIAAKENAVTVYTRGISVTVFGWQQQMVPLALAILSLTNLMLGAIHERMREISIYSSLGLSPSQVGLMFLGESFVLAIVGSILGYTSAIGFTAITLQYIPEISLNYASSWVAIAILAAMLATIASSAYPFIRISRLVTPSLERVWKPPTKPRDDEWSIPLPFTATEEEIEKVMAFLQEFMESHTLPRAETFSARRIWREDKVIEGVPLKSLCIEASIVPYDQGIQQTVRLDALRDESGKYSFSLFIHRDKGPRSQWVRSNRPFIDLIRKQFLIWRSLTDKEKARYAEKKGSKWS
ncbi:hypothetical protein DRO55_03335, partial [Candidatus Bathyarchaeota archaeon]